LYIPLDQQKNDKRHLKDGRDKQHKSRLVDSVYLSMQNAALLDHAAIITQTRRQEEE
jgi:hypothetical protein